MSHFNKPKSRGYHFVLSEDVAEILTDADDTEMFDRDDDSEEKDLDNQVGAEKNTSTNTDALPGKIDPKQLKNEVEKKEAAPHSAANPGTEPAKK